MTGDLESLTSLVRDTQVASVERRALLVRLDRLPAPLRRPHHRRLARAALDPLLVADRGCLHELPAGRLAVSWRGEAGVNLNRVMAALGHLLADASTETPALGALTSVFNLPQDGPALLAAAREGADAGAPASVAVAGKPLDVATLAILEASLARADVARFARRRPVCTVLPLGLSPAWEERLLDLQEIAAELAPGRSLEADPWLYRRLARTLERRFLALLATTGEIDGAAPFGLRLSADSALSPEFLRFDAALPVHLRGRIVIGFTPADALSDPAAFAFARDFARARGYKVLLRGITAALTAVLVLPLLSLDLVQVEWSVGLPGCTVDAGDAQIVLGGADSPAAVDWARAEGITFAQGRAALPTG